MTRLFSQSGHFKYLLYPLAEAKRQRIVLYEIPSLFQFQNYE